MFLERVRIDASLHPVLPAGSNRLGKVREDFRTGCFDHLHPQVLNALSVALRRAALLDTAAFNEKLNLLLRQYGLYVTNISEVDPEYALGYGDDYETTYVLSNARRMRDWFIPAVDTFHVFDERHMQEVDEVLENSDMRECLASH